MRFRPAALYVLLVFAAIGLGGRALASLARLLSSADRAEAPFRLVLERVTRVAPAGEEAGLRRDDRVVSVAGQALVGRRGLALALARTAPGAPLELEVERANGQRERLRVPTHGSSVSRSDRLLGLVLQQAWLLGALGYMVAFVLGEIAYPNFPRRVLITPTISLVAPMATLAIVTLASFLGVNHVMRIDPARALEG